VVLCVANLSRSAQAAEIDLSPWRGRIPFELLGRTNFPPIGEQPWIITLSPYGFYWFQLCESGARAVSIRPTLPEVETLVVGNGWRSLLAGRLRTKLERHALPAFLAGRRRVAVPGKFSSRSRLVDDFDVDTTDFRSGL